MKILFIGDVFASLGRRCVAELTPALRSRWDLDLVIANGENAAGGLGLTASLARELLDYGVDVITSGNHVWKHRSLGPFMEEEPQVLRPANYPGQAPGRGWVIVETSRGIPVGVLNLEGRVFMSNLECPFAAADAALAGPLAQCSVRIVDMHAEATSEKQAMAHHLEGRVSAVVGTHTHVQTADERIGPQGTAYITDAGMTGPQRSVIGLDPDRALTRFLTQRPLRFRPARRDARLLGVFLKLDPDSGKALGVERVNIGLKSLPAQR